VEGGDIISNRSKKITYIFENPNKSNDFEKILRQIIIEKLLHLDTIQPKTV